MKIRLRKVDEGSGERWVVDMTPAGGRRQRRFFKTQTEAEQAARETGGLWRTAGESWVSLTIPERVDLIGAYSRIRGRGFTLNQIIDQWESGQSAAAKAAKPAKSMSLRSALDAWTRDVGKVRSAKTQANYARWGNRFATGREQLPVTSLTAAMFKSWLDQFSGTSYSTYRNISKAFTSWCVTNHEMTGLVTDPIPRKTLIPGQLTNGNNERPKTLTVAQARMMLEWCWNNDRELLAYCVLATFAGIRPEEIDRLTGWDQINLDRATIRLTLTKTRKARMVHLEAVAVEWLRLAKAAGSVIGWNLGTRLARMRPLCKALGFDAWPVDVLRHTFGSYYTEKNRDVARTAHEMGNSVAVCEKHYLDAVEPDACAAFWSLTPAALNISLPANP